MESPEIRTCHRCGTALGSAEKRCSSCGTPVRRMHPAGSGKRGHDKEQLADKASADSFPASDPPAYQARRDGSI